MSLLASDLFADELIEDVLDVPDVYEPPALHIVPPPKIIAPTSDRIRVRVAPLVLPGETGWEDDQPITEKAFDHQLLVDLTRSQAKRAATAVKEGMVERLPQPHQHPRNVTCLRCAVLGVAPNLTMGTVLLEVLAAGNADEEWNMSADPPEDPSHRAEWDPTKACSDTRIISRLKRLALSAANLEKIYGPNWGSVMMLCMRAETADFALLHHLVQKYSAPRIMTAHTRETMASYHLAMIACPWTTRDNETVTSMLRSTVAVRLAVAATQTCMGQPPEWVDHLPPPPM